MQFVKLLLAFAPWFAFLLISGHSMFRLKLGIAVAAVLVVLMGVTKLHRGIILWAGALFFLYALIAVVLCNDMWAVRHMGTLANGVLAVGTWITVAFRQPFTLDYAKAHTDPASWDSPVFIRTNYMCTSVWGFVFSIGGVLAWYRMLHHEIPGWKFEAAQYLFMISAMLFSTWYPKLVKRSSIS